VAAFVNKTRQESGYQKIADGIKIQERVCGGKVERNPGRRKNKKERKTIEKALL